MALTGAQVCVPVEHIELSEVFFLCLLLTTACARKICIRVCSLFIICWPFVFVFNAPNILVH